MGDDSTTGSGVGKNEYSTLEGVGEYKGYFDEQPFQPSPGESSSGPLVSPYASPRLQDMKECNGMFPHWYTLGYKPTNSGDPFIENIQHNPYYYWYGPNLGETRINNYPKAENDVTGNMQYSGFCRPNAFSSFH